MKEVFGVHDGKAFVIDQTAGPEYIEPQMLVGMWPALAVPFFADNSRIAVGIEHEPVVRRWKYMSQDLAADFRRNPQKRRIYVQSGDGF